MKTPLETLAERIKTIKQALPDLDFDRISAGSEAFRKLNENLLDLTGISIKGSSFNYQGIEVTMRDAYDGFENKIVLVLKDSFWV